jgi:tetratricopeptide (TPR) repeat protein
MSDARTLALAVVLSLTAAAPRAEASPDVWRRSYALEARGDVRGALGAIEALPDGDRAGYLYALRHAWLLYLAGRHDDAVTAYRQAEALSPRAVEPRVGELLPLMALRRWQETEQRAREVLRLDADNYLASRRLALALYQLGRFDDAREVYQQVSARYPGDLEMVTGAAWCDLRRGRRDEAATAFRSVLSVSPDDATATAGLTATQAR